MTLKPNISAWIMQLTAVSRDHYAHKILYYYIIICFRNVLHLSGRYWFKKKDMPVELTYKCFYSYFIFYSPIFLLAVLTTLRWTLDLQISSKSPHTLWPQTLWVKYEPDWNKGRDDMLQTEIFHIDIRFCLSLCVVRHALKILHC